MAEKSEVFSPLETASDASSSVDHVPHRVRRWRDSTEIAVVFILILAAVWTPPGRMEDFLNVVATACVMAFAVAGKWSPSELGLTRPRAGAVAILISGALLCGATALTGIALRFAGAGYHVPWSRSWQYALWAMEQEFILQCIFFLRLETILGPKRAVVVAAFLFALVHLPSPVLTVLAFCGGIVFCESFKRWRNLYPIGIIHAALGLTIATSLPDQWLHHMRVGIGYLAGH